MGGTREVLDADSGVLVPARDPDALAAAVLELLGDPARARRLGEAAYGRVAAAFGARAMVARLEALYADRLAKAAA